MVREVIGTGQWCRGFIAGRQHHAIGLHRRTVRQVHEATRLLRFHVDRLTDDEL